MARFASLDPTTATALPTAAEHVQKLYRSKKEPLRTLTLIDRNGRRFVFDLLEQTAFINRTKLQNVVLVSGPSILMDRVQRFVDQVDGKTIVNLDFVLVGPYGSRQTSHCDIAGIWRTWPIKTCNGQRIL